MADSTDTSKISRETPAGTLMVALVVSLVCSSLVASAAVLLGPLQEANALLDERRNILAVAGILDEGGDVNALFEGIEPRVVDLATGAYVEDIDAAQYDALEDGQALVYVVQTDGDAEVHRFILPISGQGLWSTMYGFIALEADANTVADITFYAHGETPGVGDFIAKPAWLSLWRGKRVFDEAGQPSIAVVKGRVAADDPAADHRVDGVSGATLTGDGVTDMMRDRFGPEGYGPYLARVRRGEP